METLDIEVHNHDGVLLVDSRLVAQRCDVEHESTIRLIRQHAEVMERNFGCVRFEIGHVGMPNGGLRETVENALLTESQATFLITLCRNTQPVVEFKAALVKAFEEAKRRLGGSPAPEVLGLLHRMNDTLEAFTTGYKSLHRKVELLEFQVRTGVRVTQRKSAKPKQPKSRKAVLLWQGLTSRFFRPLGLPSWEGTALDLMLEFHKVTGDRLTDSVPSLGQLLQWLARSRPNNVKALPAVGHTNRWRIEV